MAHGGKRENSGRKMGSTAKPKITDSMSEEQIQSIIASALQKAEDGDSVLIKFLLEQYWGKAPQSHDLSDNALEALKIVFDPTFKK